MAAALVESFKALRGDNPVWGKRKIAALLKGEALGDKTPAEYLKALSSEPQLPHMS
jgi:hypothetical protein